ncbi:unknown protein [Waddlia chondrophila 2032/99]|uniref:Uncharacterized protein n=1 Tax=Waddlia chondrophila 2032/99 TaxID=765953 RepID=F8LB04_9BACT|nr:unknown protein [Waddlia chondrophila 2032/99]
MIQKVFLLAMKPAYLLELFGDAAVVTAPILIGRMCVENAKKEDVEHNF